jgi:hypothetical protein
MVWGCNEHLLSVPGYPDYLCLGSGEGPVFMATEFALYAGNKHSGRKTTASGVTSHRSFREEDFLEQGQEIVSAAIALERHPPYNPKWDQDFYTASLRTYICLKDWDRFITTEKIISGESAWRRTLTEGHSFTKLIKDFFAYGIRNATHVLRGVVNPDKAKMDNLSILAGIGDVKLSYCPSYDYVPPYSYFLNWEFEVNDVVQCLKEVSQKEELIEEFLEVFKNMLPDDFQPINPREILAISKESQSYNERERRTYPFMEARLSEKGFQFREKPTEAKRTIVYVSPANARDTIINPIDAYNSIQIALKECGRILDHFPKAAVCENTTVGGERMRRFMKKKGIFYMRDMTKNGLTVNTRLLFRMIDVLQEKYPDGHFFYYKKVLDGWRIRDGETIYHPKRGVGLGHEVQIFTMAQCVMYEMLKARVSAELGLDTDFITYNDDMTLLVKDESANIEQLEVIEMIDYDLVTGLGFEINTKKSFWSRFPIFCETYRHPDFADKRSLTVCAISSIKSTANIITAKGMMNSLSGTILAKWNKWILPLVQEVISEWGYEFYPEEANYNFLIGGWLTRKRMGLDDTLLQIEEADKESILEGMETALRAHEIRCGKEVKPSACRVKVEENVGPLGVAYGLSLLDKIPQKLLPKKIEEASIGIDRPSAKKYHHLRRVEKRYFSDKLNRWSEARSKVKSKGLDKLQLIKMAMKYGNNLCIPELIVTERTAITTSVRCRAEWPHVTMREAIPRYLAFLRDAGYITSEVDLDQFYPSMEEMILADQGYKPNPFSWEDEVTCIRGDSGGYYAPETLAFSQNVPWVSQEFFGRTATLPTKIDVEPPPASNAMKFAVANWELYCTHTDLISRYRNEFRLWVDTYSDHSGFLDLVNLLNQEEEDRKEEHEAAVTTALSSISIESKVLTDGLCFKHRCVVDPVYGLLHARRDNSCQACKICLEIREEERMSKATRMTVEERAYADTSHLKIRVYKMLSEKGNALVRELAANHLSQEEEESDDDSPLMAGW